MDDLPATAPHAPAPPGEALCRSCNLCCNGVLFDRGDANPDELGWIIESGATLDQSGTRPRFHQPCPHSTDQGCAIYADRFHVCRKFRCALLRKVEAGAVAAPEAGRLVAEARRLAAADPALATMEARRQSRGAGPPGPANEIAARAWLEAFALDRFLDRHFRNRPILRWGGGQAMSAEDAISEDADSGK